NRQQRILPLVLELIDALRCWPYLQPASEKALQRSPRPTSPCGSLLFEYSAEERAHGSGRLLPGDAGFQSRKDAQPVHPAVGEILHNTGRELRLHGNGRIDVGRLAAPKAAEIAWGNPHNGHRESVDSDSLIENRRA